MNTLNNVCIHALLHLHFKIQNSSTHVSTSKKEAILNSFLKAAATAPKYKAVKKDLKRLITGAKRNLFTLEAKLLELNEITKTKSPTELECFVSLISVIEKKWDLDFVLTEERRLEKLKPEPGNRLYFCSDGIDSLFDDNEVMIHCATLCIRGTKTLEAFVFEQIEQANFHIKAQQVEDGFHKIVITRAPGVT